MEKNEKIGGKKSQKPSGSIIHGTKLENFETSPVTHEKRSQPGVHATGEFINKRAHKEVLRQINPKRDDQVKESKYRRK